MKSMIYNRNAVKIFLFLLIILGSQNSLAQDNLSPTTIKSLNKVKLTFLGIGLERERKIGKLSSIYAGVSMDAVFPFEADYRPNRSDALSLGSFIAFTPIIYSGFRKYYNLVDRSKDNRKTKNNSAEYFGFEIDAIAPIDSEEGEFKTSWTMSFAPQWGLQRNISKNTNLEFTLGPALKTNFDKTKIFPFGRFGLSFLL